MSDQVGKSISNWSVVYATVGASILCFAFVFIAFGFDEESTRMNIRWSARFSIICFCLAFSASSLKLLAPNWLTNWIARNRKYLGVSFALIHILHLLFLVVLHQNFYQIFVPASIVELALGGLAYVFLILMLLTSFDQVAKLISKRNWDRLHMLGGYWILIVFSNSILGRVAAGKLEYLPLALGVLAVWGIRFFSWKKRRAFAKTTK